MEQDRKAIVYSGVWRGGDVRPERPLAGTEAEIVLAYLEWHRQTFELKCSDIDPARLSERSVAPSTLSLHGLARHLAAVERWWFRIQWAGEDVPMLYYSDDDPEQDFDDLSGDPLEALEVWLPSVNGPGRSSTRRAHSRRPARTPRRARRSRCGGWSCTCSPSTPSTTATPTCCARRWTDDADSEWVQGRSNVHWATVLVLDPSV